jgi:phage shock protein A
MMAVRAGDDVLAKEALQRKKEHEQLAIVFRDQWTKQKKQVDQLKLALRILNNKIEEAKRKKQVLIARKRRAEAQKKIQETMSGLNNASAFDTFERMEEKIDQIEAEADAASELAEEYSGDVLAHKFGKLEATFDAEDDLTALKQKMGLAPTPEPEPEQVRVEAQQQQEDAIAELSAAEQDELAVALAELEAQEQAEQARMKR